MVVRVQQARTSGGMTLALPCDCGRLEGRYPMTTAMPKSPKSPRPPKTVTVARPMSISNALVYSVWGCLVVGGVGYGLWGVTGGLVMLGMFGFLWVVAVFSWRSIQQDDLAHYGQLQLTVAQSPPVIQMALGLAQPLRSYALVIPMEGWTSKYVDPGLCLLGHLEPSSQRHAQRAIANWLAQVREMMELPSDAPLAFAQTLALWPAPNLPERASAGPEPDPDGLVRMTWRIHLLLCAMETGDIDPEQGQAQLLPWVEYLQQRFSSWGDYAAVMNAARWSLLDKNLTGLALQAVHMRDLRSKPQSPWVLIPFDTPLEPQA